MKIDKDTEHGKPNDTSTDERVLVLKSEPWKNFKEEALNEIKKFEKGERKPYHVRNFENPTEIQRILTQKRLELIRAIMDTSPESMKELGENLDRGLREIHDDLHLLEEYGLIELQKEGRAKKPVVPYDRIRIEVDLFREQAI